jgi:hypothetical protein
MLDVCDSQRLRWEEFGGRSSAKNPLHDLLLVGLEEGAARFYS